MEGSSRVPFIIRWPGVPADRETDVMVHEVDTFTTLLRFVGADVPKDRPIDGVDKPTCCWATPTCRRGRASRSCSGRSCMRRITNCTSSGRFMPPIRCYPSACPSPVEYENRFNSDGMNTIH